MLVLGYVWALILNIPAMYKKRSLNWIESRNEASFLHGGGDRKLVFIYERFIRRPFEAHTDPSDESFLLRATQRAQPPETGDTTGCMSCRCYTKHTCTYKLMTWEGQWICHYGTSQIAIALTVIVVSVKPFVELGWCCLCEEHVSQVSFPLCLRTHSPHGDTLSVCSTFTTPMSRYGGWRFDVWQCMGKHYSSTCPE